LSGNEESEITITKGMPNSDLYAQFRQWCISEWGDIDPFMADRQGKPLPPPIVATIDGRLVGGLAFTRAIPNQAVDYQLWINAIIVAPAYRRRGIASLLILSAQGECGAHTTKGLYALTDVPSLYLGNGWCVIEQTNDGTVLHWH
jgi:GNAT superfamily N-acetyltransferase